MTILKGEVGRRSPVSRQYRPAYATFRRSENSHRVIDRLQLSRQRQIMRDDNVAMNKMCKNWTSWAC